MSQNVRLCHFLVDSAALALINLHPLLVLASLGCEFVIPYGAKLPFSRTQVFSYHLLQHLSTVIIFPTA